MPPGIIKSITPGSPGSSGTWPAHSFPRPPRGFHEGARRNSPRPGHPMMEQLYILPILLFSVVIHEISHGWMALRLGDTTARDLGRLTLNPIPHIDPVGSVLVPLFSLVATGRVFIAWAKPVPVNPLNFSDMRRDDILVSVVGPVSNFILSFICTIIYIVLQKLSQFVPE